MQFFIPENIKTVLKTLNSADFDAFLVGGCVRDMLRGKTPHDFDIATSALPFEVEALFERTVSTGIKHGTVTVITDGVPVEVTTFRTESGYSDSRRPDKVEFVSDIKYDLSRRDFTVNAMAYNEQDGLIDLFGGKNDLLNGTLRAVGNPEVRFCEDALRILRLYRFASVLSFKIESETQKGALKFIDTLKNVSPERIFTELKKAVCGDSPEILTSFINAGGLKFLNISFSKDLTLLKGLQKKTELRNFAFFYILNADIKFVLEYLKASNSEKKYCLNLMELSKKKPPETKPEIKEILRNFGKEVFLDYLEFSNVILNIQTEKSRQLFNEITEKGEPYLISQLAVDGNCLKNLGFCGKEIKNTLEMLVCEVSKNPSLNNKENLINLVLKMGN